MEEQKTLEEVATVKPKKRAPRKPKEKASKAPSKNHPKRKELFLEDGTVNYVNTVGGCYEETIEIGKETVAETSKELSQEEIEITRRTYEQLVKQVEEESDKEFYWYIFKLLLLAVIILGAAIAL